MLTRIKVKRISYSGNVVNYRSNKAVCARVFNLKLSHCTNLVIPRLSHATKWNKYAANPSIKKKPASFKDCYILPIFYAIFYAKFPQNNAEINYIKPAPHHSYL